MIREAIAKVVEGQDLTADEAAQVMGEIMEDEATPAQLGAFLTALRVKGETLDEITGMAGVMRSKGLSVEVEGPGLMVTVTIGSSPAAAAVPGAVTSLAATVSSTLPISAGSTSMCTTLALGPNSSTLPTARSSKRTPNPMMQSVSPMAKLA